VEERDPIARVAERSLAIEAQTNSVVLDLVSLGLRAVDADPIAAVAAEDVPLGQHRLWAVGPAAVIPAAAVAHTANVIVGSIDNVDAVAAVPECHLAVIVSPDQVPFNGVAKGVLSLDFNAV